MTIQAPFLPYDTLRDVAARFLSQYHSAATIPVPIAAIVEFQFGMDIVPVPELQRSFEIDSSISNDLTTIYIDDFVFKKRPARYHYSLAHELSHRIIHADIFQQLAFNDLEQWKAAMQSIPPDQYSWIETQAYWLAGLILVPSDHLGRAYRLAERVAADAGISLGDIDPDAATTVCASIGRDFAVSADVIRRRLKRDNLCNW